MYLMNSAVTRGERESITFTKWPRTGRWETMMRQILAKGAILFKQEMKNIRFLETAIFVYSTTYCVPKSSEKKS
jgi:hypothetical protein